MKVEEFPEFEVKEYSPSQVIAMAENGMDNIADHIINGYGIPASDSRSKFEVVRDEFDHGEDRTRVFLAFNENEEVVGSLYFILWRNLDSDKRGGKFGEFLNDNGGELLDLQKMKNHRIIACDIGVVIDPNYHGKGVAQNLYGYATKSLDPAFLVGQTKTPAAVVARTRIFKELGYETCYGGRSANLSTELSKLLAEAYFYSRKDVLERFGDKHIHYAKTDGLQPAINVDLSRLPEYVSQTFLEILTADKNKKEGFITFSPLISIKRDLIK